MSYDLSFSPEFFLQEGEPYDGGPEPSTRPTSVWHAIESMRILDPERWANLARVVFGTDPQYLTEEAVLDAVQKTNTCSNLNAPVRVWIDSECNFTLLVYEAT